jgi:hypothetical protein
MPYKVFDEVTADCLQTGDLIQIDDAATSETVYLSIDEVHDRVEKIQVFGYDFDNDEVTYMFTLDPDQKMSLYMETDED